FSVLPSARPDLAQPDLAQPDLERPDLAQTDQVQSDAVKAVLERVSATDEYQVASLSRPSSILSGPANGNAASPREAVFARPAGSDPAAA
ncbi:MAG: peptidase M15, partial [Mesorhizobium sp.]